MSVEEFATCTANHIGSNTDTVLEEIKKWGQHEIQAFLTWYHGLSDSDRALFLTLLSLAGGALIAILTKAIGAAGPEIAAGLVILAGVAAWAIIIDAMSDCSDKL